MNADELGAHVSAAGGVDRAPERAALLGARVLQLFTKQPSRWAEPEITPEARDRFRAERRKHGIGFAGAHDSYLINLASSDPVLFARSAESFGCELARCAALGLDALVTHPGNATDRDRPRALTRNAQTIAAALASDPAGPRVLIETTAGAGTALGAHFGEIAELIRLIEHGGSDRVGVCVDTCHLWAAGYDLVRDYDGVFAEFDDTIGLERIGLFHLNDSLGMLGSRRDRHAHIGKGALGPEPFRRLLNDARFASVPKVIETPKDADVLAADRRNLRVLRAYRARTSSGSRRSAKKSRSP